MCLGESVDSFRVAGVVFLFSGGLRGVGPAGVQTFSRATPGIPGRVDNAYFGTEVTVLDRRGDGRAEAVVTAYEENFEGSVTIIRGTSGGLTGRGARRLFADALGRQRPEPLVTSTEEV
jgi:hypothetical protein